VRTTIVLFIPLEITSPTRVLREPRGVCGAVAADDGALVGSGGGTEVEGSSAI